MYAIQVIQQRMKTQVHKHTALKVLQYQQKVFTQAAAVSQMCTSNSTGTQPQQQHIPTALSHIPTAPSLTLSGNNTSPQLLLHPHSSQYIPTALNTSPQLSIHPHSSQYIPTALNTSHSSQYIPQLSIYPTALNTSPQLSVSPCQDGRTGQLCGRPSWPDRRSLSLACHNASSVSLHPTGPCPASTARLGCSSPCLESIPTPAQSDSYWIFHVLFLSLQSVHSNTCTVRQLLDISCPVPLLASSPFQHLHSQTGSKPMISQNPVWP